LTPSLDEGPIFLNYIQHAWPCFRRVIPDMQKFDFITSVWQHQGYT